MVALVPASAPRPLTAAFAARVPTTPAVSTGNGRTPRAVDPDRADPTRGRDGARTAVPSEDGRSQRRLRNRDAVVRALLSLYEEGNLDPSADEIATRSGVSARSVFRYFDDVSDLADAAINQKLLDVAHLVPLSAQPTDPTAHKVAALVRQRAELFEATGAAGLVARLRAPFQPSIAARIDEARRYLRSQVDELFADEFAAIERAEGSAAALAVTAAVEVLTSFESWRLLRTDGHREPRAAAAVVAEAVTRLLGA